MVCVTGRTGSRSYACVAGVLSARKEMESVLQCCRHPTVPFQKISWHHTQILPLRQTQGKETDLSSILQIFANGDPVLQLLDEMDVRMLDHLAKLLADLLSKESLALAILKVGLDCRCVKRVRNEDVGCRSVPVVVREAPFLLENLLLAVVSCLFLLRNPSQIICETRSFRKASGVFAKIIGLSYIPVSAMDCPISWTRQ